MTDDLLPNLLHEDRRPPSRLREYFETRTVAEMSIWFWIAAVSSSFLDIGCMAVLSNWIKSRGGSSTTYVVLGGLIVWLGFLAWLWISFVRIARGWGPERLGLFIFRYLQKGLVATTVAIAIQMPWASIRDFSFLILAFDSVLVGMVLIFLPLAWCARCRVPWSAYREVFVVIALFVLQIVLMVRGHRS